MAGFLKSRTVKYGSNALVGVLMALGILAVVNFLSSRTHWRFDTTGGGIYSLSDQTTTLLGALEKDVHVTAFFREHNRGRYENLLKDYAYHSKRFSYRFVDPDRQPAEARRYRVKAYSTSVIEAGNKEERITSTAEKDLTNAIAKAIRDREKVIYFLTGHGEAVPENPQRDGYNKVKQALQEVNYVVHDTLLLVQERQVPSDCNLLVVAGPKTQLFQAEVDSIRSYLEAGGAGLFLLDPGVQSGLEPMLKAWSVSVNDDYVVDNSGIGRLFGLDYSMPVAAQYGRHPITEKHAKGVMTFFMLARSVTREGTVPGVEAVELVGTSRGSWGESDLSPLQGKRPEKVTFDEGVDRKGPLGLAVAVSAVPKRHEVVSGDEAQARTRIVVFGDSDFANNQFFGAQGNGDLFLNSVNWLLEEGSLIAIRPKERGFGPISLTQTDAEWIFWLSLVVLPGIPVVAGILVWRKRR